MNILRNLKRAIIYSLPETLWSEYVVAYINYFINNGKFPNLKNPKNFNEKTLWRRFHERDLDFVKYVDKYEVRKHIENTIGSEYLVPLIGVYEDVEEIDFDSLPNRFILKTTHGSGGNMICEDKESFNWDKNKVILKKLLQENYYKLSREISYKDCKKRIVCEELIETNITDYKFFCYYGNPKYIQIDINRNNGIHKRSFYDINWNKIKKAKNKFENILEPLQKPRNFEEMLRIAKILSKDFTFLRVDLYSSDNKVFFGELTIFPGSGVSKIEPLDFFIELGKPLKLDIK
jgi:hypothetical protein